MSLIRTASRSTAALAGISMLATSLSPAWAFTAPGPTLQASISSQIEDIQFKRWGWAPALVGGVAAGAIIGSALAAPRYYGPAYYGPGYYSPDYGPCWRREIDPWGREFWARAC
jgi:hypothetical protein